MNIVEPTNDVSDDNPLLAYIPAIPFQNDDDDDDDVNCIGSNDCYKENHRNPRQD